MKIKIAVFVISFLTLLSCSQPSEQEIQSNESPVKEQVNIVTVSSSQYADTVYTTGSIYTVDDSRSWAEALAIKDGILIAVGSTVDVLTHASEMTEVIDLQGRMVMPGLHDAHVHLELGGITMNLECALPEGATQEQIVAVLKACEVKRPGGWITSSAIAPFIFPNLRMTNGFLNEAFPDTPVFLRDYSFHHGLANAKALELAGVNRNTPSPPGGRIVFDEETGEPTGELVENATALIHQVLPPYEDSDYYDALKWSIALNNSLGITSVQEASANRRILENLNRIEGEGELSLHVAAHIVWKNESFSESSVDELESLRSEHSRYSSDYIHTDFVKMWLDGAPMPPNDTAAGLNDNGLVNEEWLLYTQDEISSIITSVDAQGISAKMHVASEGSARVALNAIEQARNENGDSGLFHELVHAPQVHEDDMVRMAQLGAIAEMSPALWHLPMSSDGELPDGWDFKSMLKNNVTVTIGTDTLYGAQLFPALEGVLTRPGLSVDLPSALEMMTINGARAIRQQDMIGSLETGKSATFIILDRNLFEIPVEDISETRVLRTVFEGEVVYSSADEL